jgi:hypothetical protein
MKKILTLFLLFSLLVFQGYAQSAQVTVGPDNKIKGIASFKVLGMVDGSVYVLRSSIKIVYIGVGFLSLPGETTLERLDFESLKIEESIPVVKDKTKIGKLDAVYDGIVKLKKNFVAFATTNDKSANEKASYAKFANDNDGTYEKVAFIKAKKSKRADFEYYASSDSSCVLVTQKLPYGEDDGDEQSMEYTLLDKDLKEVYNKKVTFPYKEKSFGIVDHLVDNQGNIFVLAQISRNKKEKKKTKDDARYYFSICYIAKNSTEAIENEIDLKGKYITDIDISMSPKGEVSCFGFYAELKKFALEGTFFAKMSSNGKLETANYKKFDSEFLDMLNSESTSKSVNNAGRVSPTYDLRSIDYLKDGSVIVLAEKYYVRVVYYIRQW